MQRDYILILGGLGFLGANVSEFHREKGDDVLIVCREKSIRKRWFLYKQLKEIGVRFLIRDTINPALILDILRKWGTPLIFYNVIGKLQGKRRDLIYSHVTLPYTWSREIIKKEEETLIIYVSHAFQFNCYKIIEKGKTILVEEEDEHLGNCITKTVYEETKALGERLILSIESKRCKIVILRPGLLVGRYSYHPEWKILYKLANKGIIVGNGIRMPVTPAIDIPRIGRLLLDKDLNRDWFHVVPYTVDMGDLHGLMIKLMNTEKKIRIPTGNLFKIISKIGLANVLGPISSQLDEKTVYSTRKLRELGYVKWTPLAKAIKESIEWMRGIGV